MRCVLVCVGGGLRQEKFLRAQHNIDTARKTMSDKKDALYLRMSLVSDIALRDIAEVVFIPAMEGVEVHLIEQKKLAKRLTPKQRDRLWSDSVPTMVASVRKHFRDIFIDRILTPLSDSDIDLMYRLSSGDYSALQENAKRVRDISADVRARFMLLRGEIVEELEKRVARTFKPQLGALAAHIEALVSADGSAIDEELVDHVKSMSIGEARSRNDTAAARNEDDDDSDADVDDKAKAVDWEGVD